MSIREEVRDALTGPVASVRTSFLPDGSIDLRGMQNYVDFVIEAGSKTVMLTHGDSLFSILTDQEVAEVTEMVGRHVAGRALVIAADRQWWTSKEIEFACYAREKGVGLLMVLPPDWGGSATPQTMVDHYAAVAEHIPVMVVTGVFSTRPKDFALEILDILKETVDNVVAVKDDWCGEFGRELGKLVHDRWAVIAGGQKQNHMNAHPYGCDGYLSTFIAFKPEIAHNYWKAIQADDLDKANHIIAQYDKPFFDLIAALPGGFDAGIHGALEVFGITKRWRRGPYYNLNDQEMEKLADFFKEKSLL